MQLYSGTTKYKNGNSSQKKKESLTQLEFAIKDLDSGKFECDKGIITTNLGYKRNHKEKLYDIYQIGHVSSISFPSVCVFTGLCTSKAAIQTAKQSKLNKSSPNTYYHKLKDYMDQHKLDDTRGLDLTKDSTYYNCWNAIAKSWGEVSASMENGCCGVFRSTPKMDVFLNKQTLYDLQCDQETVMVKTFGSTTWKRMEPILSDDGSNGKRKTRMTRLRTNRRRKR